MAEKNAKEMVKTAVAALQDKKGEDIRVIDISGVTVIADYFIIAHGGREDKTTHDRILSVGRCGRNGRNVSDTCKDAG